MINGIPGTTTYVPSWVANSVTGTFTAEVKVKPYSGKPAIRATGIYLPKDKRAWGYFPGGKTGGGYIAYEL